MVPPCHVYPFVRVRLMQAQNFQRKSHVRDGTTSTITRSQAVARIADRTASQHLWGYVRDVIGHVTI